MLMSEATFATGKKILVVDDNPVILKTMALALGNKGYKVFTAEGASEAFGVTRQENPDLILLDIFFPPDIDQNGMTWNAFRIIEWMHRIGVAPGIPIIIISSAEPDQFKNRCLDAGAVAFFQKPINVPELLDTIHEVLSREKVVDSETTLAFMQHVAGSAAASLPKLV